MQVKTKKSLNKTSKGNNMIIMKIKFLVNELFSAAAIGN